MIWNHDPAAGATYFRETSNQDSDFPTWVAVAFDDLKTGDVFRVRHEGRIAINRVRATSDPYDGADAGHQRIDFEFPLTGPRERP